MNAVVEIPQTPKGAVVVSAPSEGDSVALMRIIERAALTQDFDVTKLQQLLDVKERWDAVNSRKAFVAAMAAFKADPPEIVKDKHVSYKNKTGGTTEYDHATLGKICAGIIKGLADHGISHRWDVSQNDNRIKVTCVLTHEQGHSESVSLNAAADDSGGKNNIQAIGSAITYLQRYSLLAATGLAAEDMDDDGRASSAAAPGYFITENQITDLMALAEEVKADRTAFLKFMKVTQLAEIPASQYKVAVAGLESRRGK